MASCSQWGQPVNSGLFMVYLCHPSISSLPISSGLMIKMKIQYTLNGQQVVEQAQVSAFPAGY